MTRRGADSLVIRIYSARGGPLPQRDAIYGTGTPGGAAPRFFTPPACPRVPAPCTLAEVADSSAPIYSEKWLRPLRSLRLWVIWPDVLRRPLRFSEGGVFLSYEL